MSNNTQKDEDKGASYPYSSLETCLEVADAVKSLGGGKSPVSKSLLASALKEDERSQTLIFKIASAKTFGLIKGRSDFMFTELAMNYYFPLNEKDRKVALLAVLEQPRAFKSIIKRFDGSKLPEKEILGNILHREEDVPESWKQRVAANFVQSAKLAAAVDSQGFLRVQAAKEGQLANKTSVVEADNVTQSESERLATIPSDISVTQQVPHSPSSLLVTKSTWAFAHKTGQIKVETPENMSMELWTKLNAYVQLLRPPDVEERK